MTQKKWRGSRGTQKRLRGRSETLEVEKEQRDIKDEKEAEGQKRWRGRRGIKEVEMEKRDKGGGEGEERQRETGGEDKAEGHRRWRGRRGIEAGDGAEGYSRWI